MAKEIISIIIANSLLLLSLNPIVTEDLTEIDENISSQEEQIQMIDIPDESGSVENLPWEDDPDFLESQEKNDAYELMGAYCSVLIDPLPGESDNVDLAASSTKGILVGPGQVFSQNESIGPYTKDRGYKIGTSFAIGNLVESEGGGVCKIATSLYNVAVLCDMDIVERHYHSMPVNYVPYGQDATVAYGYKDFKFKNTRDYPILIWSEIVGHRLYIGFYGKERTTDIKWEHEIYDIVDYPTYYRDNADLGEGEEKLVLRGIDGARVESKVTVYYKDGSTETKDMGMSQYQPLPEIIEIREGSN